MVAADSAGEVMQAGGQPRVVGELRRDIGRYRVVVVTGVAGWGKTTAVMQVVRERSVAWLVIDRRHAHPARFVGGLADALRQRGCDVSVPLPEAGSAEERVWQPAIDQLCRTLEELGRELVVVFDDLQELPSDAAALRVLADLCRGAPEALRLVLITRHQLPFSLTRLRGRGLVGDVDTRQLELDRGEVEVLLRAEVEKASAGLIDRVWECTGGWPAAVRIAIDAIGRTGEDRWVAALDALVRPGGRLREYVLEEVLACEPDQVVDLLRQLAVLGCVSVSVCRGLGWEDAADLLPELARRGLVRAADGDAGQWSLIRPLAGVLSSESVMTTQDAAALHRTAADYRAAARLLAEHGEAMVESGHGDVVLAASGVAPAELDRSRITPVLGHARYVRGQLDEAMAAFDAVAHSDPLDAGLAWRMGLIAFARAEFDEALTIFRRAELGSADADEALLLAWAARTHLQVGHRDRCAELATRALAVARGCGDQVALATAYSAHADLAIHDGDRLRGEADLAAAQRAAQAGGSLLQQLGIDVTRAFHLLELGLPHQALRETGCALRLAEQSGHATLAAFALTHRATAEARIGRMEEALCDFRAARDLFASIGSRFISRPLCGIAEAHRVRGELAQAAAAYQEALEAAKSHHEAYSLSCALTGLARVSVIDDPHAAVDYADQAVALGPGHRQVQALLTRGWVALATNEPDTARIHASRAAALARRRRDRPGLAEALELTVLASPSPAEHGVLAAEAAQIWQELGYPIDQAFAQLIVAGAATHVTSAAAEAAVRVLHQHRVRTTPPQAAGPLAVLLHRERRVSIRTLGALQVFRDGKPVASAEWHSKKARQLVRILTARHGRPIAREQLMELLWPKEDPARTSNRLSVLLSTVRTVLQPSGAPGQPVLLVSDRDAVWLDLDHVDVDVECFLTLAGPALDAHTRGSAAATAQLITAEAAYTGDFLEDTPYQEWAIPLREEARTTYLNVLHALTTRLRDAEDVDRMTRYALRLLAYDDYDEQAHLDLVRGLVRAGRRGEARRRYSVYCQRMKQLDVTPAPFPHR
ncbi:hypothetical protein DMH04_47855 [Kibdelosporangium aridum]|uniref:Bacterial transcriptional activator domain-containing protein n=2 Tax=Kibdelosporangium aridum TaxID=2030 RepID=A0A428YJY8_KIBAR|nr:hypothetical protein DMH04_47855 [Kibdelosporangium aridum]